MDRDELMGVTNYERLFPESDKDGSRWVVGGVYLE